MRQSHRRQPLLGYARVSAAAGAVALASSIIMPSSTETAIANGDTRTLNLYHSHTGESIKATFRVNGSYDPAVLEKLNWFLRDWRNNDRTRMDPRLFDVIWEVYRTAGATQPIVIISAYRSPQTNAMLRRRSRGVAERSQHILGRAMDTTMPGMPMERIREIGMRLQRGGVGWYPSSNFVHLDVASVRAWPRMSYDQLARLFPDGKTVHLAADGRALPRYQEARAEIASRGGVMADVPQAAPLGGLFAWLFGKHDEDEDAEAARQQVSRPARGPRGVTEVAALRTNGPSLMSTRPAVPSDRGNGRAATTAAAPSLANYLGSNEASSAGADRAKVANLDPVPSLRGGRLRDERGASEMQDQGAAEDLLNARTGKGAAFAAPAPLPPPRPAQPGDNIAIAFADVPTPPSRPLQPGDNIAIAFADVPTPPSRPLLPGDNIAIAFADVPTPPSRPVQLTRIAALMAAKIQSQGGKQGSDGIAITDAEDGALARAASLPVVITQGPADHAGVPKQVLAFAAETPVQDSRGIALSTTPSDTTSRPTTQSAGTAARINRARLRGLANNIYATFPAPSILGQSLTGLRRAARLIPGALSNRPSAEDYVSAFGAAASDLDPERFTGAAVKPLTLAQGFVRLTREN